VADAIEQALVGATDDPIPRAGDEAEAVFYVLNVGFNRTGLAQTEERALYRAARELYEERPREA